MEIDDVKNVVYCKDCMYRKSGMLDADECTAQILHVNYVDGDITYHDCIDINRFGDCEYFKRKETFKEKIKRWLNI